MPYFSGHTFERSESTTLFSRNILLKTSYKKEKMLITNILLFFPQGFLHFQRHLSTADNHCRLQMLPIQTSLKCHLVKQQKGHDDPGLLT